MSTKQPRMERLRKLARRAGSVALVAARVVASAIQFDEILLATGLGLLAYGAGQAWAPAGALVPGAILVWMTLPKREGFLRRPSGEGTDPVPSRRTT